MIRANRRKEAAVVLFGFFLLLFFPPVLGLYNLPHIVFGVPVAFAVLYGAWFLFVALIALSARRGKKGRAPSPSRVVE